MVGHSNCAWCDDGGCGFFLLEDFEFGVRSFLVWGKSEKKKYIQERETERKKGTLAFSPGSSSFENTVCWWAVLFCFV